MPKRDILILDDIENPWADFLHEYFEDTRSVPVCLHDPSEFRHAFERSGADLLFVAGKYLNKSLSQALNAARLTQPELYVFGLGVAAAGNHERFEEVFPEGIPMSGFQRKLMKHLPLPDRMDVLVVDDEAEIGGMIRDFFELRSQPAFRVRHSENGAKALDEIQDTPPDVMILDIKMPVKDGRELYREVCERGLDIPTIVFFDAVSGEELAEMRRYGKPAVIEKGAPAASLPELLELVKKVYYFS